MMMIVDRLLQDQHVSITRRIEFDAGHRIPDHKSKCRNIHGHRYVLEATVRGQLKEEGSDAGMVQDFGDLKQIMQKEVGDIWDHGLLLFMKDPLSLMLCNLLNDCIGVQHKTIYLEEIPTVENLVHIAADKLRKVLPSDILLVHVRLYETPNCWADWYGQYIAHYAAKDEESPA